MPDLNSLLALSEVLNGGIKKHASQQLAPKLQPISLVQETADLELNILDIKGTYVIFLDDEPIHAFKIKLDKAFVENVFNWDKDKFKPEINSLQDLRNQIAAKVAIFTLESTVQNLEKKILNKPLKILMNKSSKDLYLLSPSIINAENKKK